MVVDHLAEIQLISTLLPLSLIPTFCKHDSVDLDFFP